MSSPCYISFIPVTVESVEALNSTLNLYPTHANNSYRCNAAETIDLFSNKTAQPLQLTLRNMQLEAFRSRGDYEFSKGINISSYI